jgi:acyl-CoA reductase-like NAD-dependent aldehyde dehydrogenase
MSQNTENLPVVPLLIGGVETAGSPSDIFPVYSYAQNKDVYLAESANVETAKAAADAAAVAFKTWKKTSARDRRDILLRYADLLESHADELGAVQIAETSAPALMAKKNVQLATGLIRETAACITSLKGEIPQGESPDVLPLAFTVPIGPVLVIAPCVSLFLRVILLR